MEFIHEDNRIVVFSPDKEILAEVDFPKESDGIVNVNHTFVDDSLRGQGVAGKLMDELVSELRKSDVKAILSCSYAVNWFEKHPECGDVLHG